MSSTFDFLLTLLAGALTEEAMHRAIERSAMLRRWLELHKNSAEIERFLAAEMIRSYPQLYEFIDADLKSSDVSINGNPVTMMTRNLNGADLAIPVALIGTNPVNLLSPDAWTIERRPDWENAPHIKVQRKLGRIIQDNLCYTADAISVSPDATTIKGGLTTYGSALATQDRLEWEFLDKGQRYLLGHSGHLDFGEFGNLLSRRRSIIQDSGNWILEGAGSYNSLAISTQIVYPDEGGGYRLLVGKRSAKTGAHAHLFHVVPACMFQPELGDPDAEWSIFHNVLKEYLEEIYSVDLQPNAIDASYFYSHPRAVALCNALDSGEVEFIVTGLVVNLLNLRPEICCLLLVKSRAWWNSERSEEKMNWEYAPRQSILEESGRAWTDFRLDSAELEFSAYFGASPGMWVPSGLASFWLGVDAARARI